MRPLNHNRIQKPVVHSGFTLVEMMVSVTLVLMMMTLFASIFQMATGTMATQRAISENDQRARSLVTVIRKDFQHRTMRYPFSFYPGEDSSTSVTSFTNRSGYFYLSTNDPNSGLDDHLQFTVSANILSEDPDDTPFFGAAVPLTDRRTDGPAITQANRESLAVNPNQPETDDGSLSANFVGTSPAAEISYFVRNGNLYRRVLLIREPMAVSGQNLSPQPTARSGYDFFSGQPDTTDVSTYDGLFLPTGGSLTNDFYRLFDYSAYSMVPFPGQRRAEFLGVASLGNETSGAANQVLGYPNRRFGFNPATGLCREHTVAAATGVPKYIGSFLHAETSTLNFNWPQGTSTNEPASPTDTTVPDLAQILQVDLDANGSLETTTNGNPFDLTGCPLALNAGNGLVSAFDAATSGEGRGGMRRMEDLLLANVHEMKVEIWDERLGRYATPGHSSLSASSIKGDYHIDRCLNPNFTPLPGTLSGTVFDTWHPLASVDADGNSIVTQSETSAPYVPYRFYPPRLGDTPTGPSPNSMETSTVASYWVAGGTGGYSAGAPGVVMDGSVVFAPVTFDGDGTQVFEWPNRPAISGTTTDVVPSQAFNIGYVCIETNDAGGNNNGTVETGASPPVFPTTPGRTITDGEVKWLSFDNRRPLKSIRLQIRFQDKTSDTMRQVSLVIPMTEERI